MMMKNWIILLVSAFILLSCGSRSRIEHVTVVTGDELPDVLREPLIETILNEGMVMNLNRDTVSKTALYSLQAPSEDSYFEIQLDHNMLFAETEKNFNTRYSVVHKPILVSVRHKDTLSVSIETFLTLMIQTNGEQTKEGENPVFAWKTPSGILWQYTYISSERRQHFYVEKKMSCNKKIWEVSI